MSWFEVVLLLVGGAFAGAVNAMAGGGSTLTVPLLVIAGLEGNVANGSNRVGILTSAVSTAASFRNEGVKVTRELAPIIGPGLVGAPLGAFVIDRFTDDAFERFFGLLMIPIILLTIFRPKVKEDADPWPLAVTIIVFFAIGVYAGAIQAGVGLILLAALSRAGLDLVGANLIKILFTLFVTVIALGVFLAQGNVRWAPAIVLAVGLSLGGWIGAKFAVRGGEQWIRAVMVVAAVALAIRLIFFS